MATATADKSFFTALQPQEEKNFLSWVQTNGVPFDPSPQADYDMRGFWKALQNGDPRAKSAVNPSDNRLHFPDVWKTPYHKTFSNESIYAGPDAPSWKDNKLVDKTGKVIADESPDAAVPSIPDTSIITKPLQKGSETYNALTRKGNLEQPSKASITNEAADKLALEETKTIAGKFGQQAYNYATKAAGSLERKLVTEEMIYPSDLLMFHGFLKSFGNLDFGVQPETLKALDIKQPSSEMTYKAGQVAGIIAMTYGSFAASSALGVGNAMEASLIKYPAMARYLAPAAVWGTAGSLAGTFQEGVQQIKEGKLDFERFGKVILENGAQGAVGGAIMEGLPANTLSKALIRTAGASAYGYGSALMEGKSQLEATVMGGIMGTVAALSTNQVTRAQQEGVYNGAVKRVEETARMGASEKGYTPEEADNVGRQAAAAFDQVVTAKGGIEKINVAEYEKLSQEAWNKVSEAIKAKPLEPVAQPAGLPEPSVPGAVTPEIMPNGTPNSMIQELNDLDTKLNTAFARGEKPPQEWIDRVNFLGKQVSALDANLRNMRIPKDALDASALPASSGDRDFSSTQVNLPAPAAQKVLGLAAAIPETALAKDGRETEPHITVKYGIHGNDVEPIRKALENEPPITVKLGETSIFPDSQSGSGDVVKIDVDSPDLHRLNRIIKSAVPTTDTHPTYQPHVTLAYVKPGMGQQFAGNKSLAGTEVTLDHVVFSGKDGKNIVIPLTGAPKALPDRLTSEAKLKGFDPLADIMRRGGLNPEYNGDFKAMNLPNNYFRKLSKLGADGLLEGWKETGVLGQDATTDDVKRIVSDALLAKKFKQPAKTDVSNPDQLDQMLDEEARRPENMLDHKLLEEMSGWTQRLYNGDKLTSKEKLRLLETTDEFKRRWEGRQGAPKLDLPDTELVREARRYGISDELLMHEIYADQLTDLPNRKYVIQKGLHKDGHIFFDLDHFKHTNDTYGHPVGDRVLKAIGDLAQTMGITIARMGGEEFMAVPSPGENILAFVKRFTDYQAALKKMVITNAADKPIFTGINLSAAFGHEIGEAGSKSGSDYWLYQAKADGRDRLLLDKNEYLEYIKRHGLPNEWTAGTQTYSFAGGAATPSPREAGLGRRESLPRRETDLRPRNGSEKVPPVSSEPQQTQPRTEAVNLGGKIQDQGILPGTPDRTLPPTGLEPKAPQSDDLLGGFRPEEVQPDLLDETTPKKKAGGPDASANPGSAVIDAFEATAPAPAPAKFKLSEEVQKIYKKFETRVGERYVSGEAGLFYTQTHNVRLRALNDVSTAAHELSHAIDKKYDITKPLLYKTTGKNGNPIYDPSWKGVRKDLTSVYSEYYPRGRKSHKLEKRMVEGFATFVQKFIEHPVKIQEQYPALVREILTAGGRLYNQDVVDMIKDFRDVVSKYQNLDPLHKVDARVTTIFKQSGLDKSFLSTWEKIVTQAVDEVYPIEKLGKMAGVERTIADPSLWVRQYNNSSAIVLNNIKGDDGFWSFRDGDFVKVADKNLGDLVSMLQKKNATDDFNDWLVARDQHFGYQELDRLKSAAMAAQQFLEEAAAAKDNLLGGGLLDAVMKKDIEEAKGKIENYRRLKKVLAGNGFDRDVVAKAYEEHKARFVEEEKLFDTFTESDLRLLLESRKITRAQFTELTSKKGYAPLKRDVYDEVLGPGEKPLPAARTGPARISGMISRKGSQLDIIAPLASLFKDHAEVMRKSLKQIIINKVYDLSKNFPELFQEIALQRVYDPNTGITHYPQERNPDIIVARDVNGKRVPILAAREIKTVIDDVLGFQNVHIFERLLRRASSIFTKGTTGAYPLFAPSNFVIDQITAAAQTRNQFIPLYDPIAKMFNAMMDHDSPEAKYLAAYLQSGGERQTFARWQDLPPDELFNAIQGEKKALEKVADLIDMGMNVVAWPAAKSEVMSRAAEYIKSRMNGNPHVVAMEDAGRTTAPFHHVGRLGGGTFGKTLIKSVPFFNPGIQVLAQYSRTLGNKSTRNRALFVTMAVMASTVASMAYLMAKGTQTQKDLYNDLEAGELANYIWLPHPDGKRLIKIRVPEQMIPIAALMNMELANLNGATFQPGDFMSAATAFLPNQVDLTDPVRAFFAAIPQLVKPGLMVLVGKKDWPKLRDMESKSLEGKEPRERFTESTSQFAKFLGDKLNLSPIKIDYLIEGYFGRLTRFFTVKTIQNPFTRDYYFTAGRNLQDYYEIRNDVRQTYQAIKDQTRQASPEEFKAVAHSMEQIDMVEGELQLFRHLEGAIKAGHIKDEGQVQELRTRILDGIGTLRSIKVKGAPVVTKES